MSSTERVSDTAPTPIMQMATGFWVSKTLMTAVELEVFTKISSFLNDKNVGSISLEEFQDIIGIRDSRPAEAFTTALVSLGLLKVNKNAKGEKTFGNSQLSSLFLDKSKSTYIGDVITFFDEREYKSWDKLSEALKTNKPVNKDQGGDIESIFDRAKSNQEVEQIQKFTRAMYGISVGPAMALAKRVDFSKYKRIMDIGGGSGVYAIQVVVNNPGNMSAVYWILNLFAKLLVNTFSNSTCWIKFRQWSLISSMIKCPMIVMWHFCPISYIFLMERKTSLY